MHYCPYSIILILLLLFIKRHQTWSHNMSSCYACIPIFALLVRSCMWSTQCLSVHSPWYIAESGDSMSWHHHHMRFYCRSRSMHNATALSLIKFLCEKARLEHLLDCCRERPLILSREYIFTCLFSGKQWRVKMQGNLRPLMMLTGKTSVPIYATDSGLFRYFTL